MTGQQVTTVLELLALGVLSGIISLTMTRAKVTKPFRNRIKARNAWLGELFDCPYCFSHWVAAILTIIYRPRIVELFWPIDLIVSAAIIVALSAVVAAIVFYSVSMIPQSTAANGDSTHA